MERQQVDIGGVALDTVLSGHGNVTVIFENGLATSLEEWDGALNLGPPYLIVGHSWGGAIARVFAHTHPAEVVGLVLVDATHEAIDSAGLALMPAFYAVLGVASRPAFVRKRLVGLFCPPTAPASYRSRVERTLADPARWAITLRTARGEGAGLRVSLAALRRDCSDLPRVPVSVLTARNPHGAGGKSARLAHQAWEAMVARASNARLTNVPTSGHHMPLDAPGIVTRAIADMLDLIDPMRSQSP